jgi:hypothetical protein
MCYIAAESDARVVSVGRKLLPLGITRMSDLD